MNARLPRREDEEPEESSDVADEADVDKPIPAPGSPTWITDRERGHPYPPDPEDASA